MRGHGERARPETRPRKALVTKVVTDINVSERGQQHDHRRSRAQEQLGAHPLSLVGQSRAIAYRLMLLGQVRFDLHLLFRRPIPELIPPPLIQHQRESPAHGVQSP